MTRTTSSTHRPGPQRSQRRRLGDVATATSAERRGTPRSGARGRAPERWPTKGSRTSATRAPVDAIRRALAPTPQSSEELATLWAMSATERIEAMWHGQLSLAQLCKWSSRRPHEVPLIAGEFAWIVIRTPAWAEADDAANGTSDIEGTS